MRRQPPTPPDDPLLRRARRAIGEGRRLLGAAAGPAPDGAVLAGVADLVAVLRGLVAERDRLAAELETVDRRARAVTAYRTCALSTRASRAKRS